MEIECRGKKSWPELVGEKGEAAEVIVERENKNVKAILLKDGTIVTMDYRRNRVCVWVDDNGGVVRVPEIG